MGFSPEKFIEEALAEDLVDPAGKIMQGDHSSLASMPGAHAGRARLICKSEGIISGVEVARMVFKLVDRDIEFEQMLNDGAAIKHGDEAFRIFGEVKSILQAERLLLNFMQRMSGIATLTSKFADRVEGTKAKILDTRKTTPNFRYYEKWAVRTGGGYNHRYGLFDAILLKDNHLDFCGGIEKAIGLVKEYQLKNGMNLTVEIETRNLTEVQQVLRCGHVNRIMFDNFTPAEMKKAVDLVEGKFETEASGGIGLENVREFAETGVDFISVGALTHSAVSLDLSLKAF